MLEQIQVIDAREIPADVLDYCVEHEIETHYQHGIYYIEDDGNIFSEWLKTQGYEFDEKYPRIGIIAT